MVDLSIIKVNEKNELQKRPKKVFYTALVVFHSSSKTSSDDLR
jgi:hypothetical protein